MQTKIIVFIVIVAGAFAAGRYSVPEKVRIETKIVEKEKTSTDAKKDKHQKIVVVVTKKPDGETQVTKTITTDTQSDTQSQTVATTQEDTLKEKKSATDKVTISALAGIDFTQGHPVWGASVSKPILGPLTLGVWAMTNPSCGVSVGLSF